MTPNLNLNQVTQQHQKAKAREGEPINIPLDNISQELKRILVKEMVKGGRAKVVKKSQVKGQGK